MTVSLRRSIIAEPSRVNVAVRRRESQPSDRCAIKPVGDHAPSRARVEERRDRSPRSTTWTAERLKPVPCQESNQRRCPMRRQRLRRSNTERPRIDWHSSPSTGRSAVTATAEMTTRAPARRWCRSLPSTRTIPSVGPKQLRSAAPARIRSRARASRMERIRPTNPGDSVLRSAREEVFREAALSLTRRAPAREDVKWKRPRHTNFPSQRPKPRSDERDRQSGRKRTEAEREERGESWPRVRTFYFSDQWLFLLATSHRSLATGPWSLASGHCSLPPTLVRQYRDENIALQT